MTALDVANEALSLLGVEPIFTMDEQTKSARVMSHYLPIITDRVLMEFPWSFAIKWTRSDLGITATRTEFGFAHPIPTDLLSVYLISVGDGSIGNKMGKTPLYFQRMGDIIYTDTPLIDITYIARITDYSAWTAQVLSCLSCRLAMDTANLMMASLPTANALRDRYGMLIRVAAASSVVEHNFMKNDPDQYIVARR